jgi:uncharacterized protein YdhG (YjbR/CyaY superfamily)
MPKKTSDRAALDRSKVREYIAELPPESRKAVKRLRDAIRAAAPRATEAFSYGIPGFRMDGQMLMWYAGWKRHASIYPMTAAVRRAHAKDLAAYEMARGTLRFPLDETLPIGLVRRLVRTRLAELRSKSTK